MGSMGFYKKLQSKTLRLTLYRERGYEFGFYWLLFKGGSYPKVKIVIQGEMNIVWELWALGKKMDRT